VARPLRVGGRGTTPGGRSVTWSVAEGTRGRRWREVVRAGEGIAHSLLLETDMEGRFSHLELSTPSGLLTLHPEADGTLHGHAVVSDGIEHVAGLRWEPDAIVALDGSVVCMLAAAHLLRPRLPAGESRAQLSARIPPTLWVEVGPVRVGRAAGGEWQIGDGPPLRIDPVGLPELTGGEVWPLEVHAEASDTSGPGARHRAG
jgi:hypothetical protein